MTKAEWTSAPFLAAFVLGFALSGFFDGVLLHQILQWHHLLSLVDAEAMRSVRAQILADGLFHALMYVVALAGLGVLWRSRRSLADEGGARRLWSGALIGFGVWNIVDVVGVHWMLRLHRLRLDVADPLTWDVGWLAGLGVAPVVLGLIVGLTRSRRGMAGGGSAALLLLAVLAAGAVNLRPAPPTETLLAVFASPADVFPAMAAVDATLIQTDASGAVAVLKLPAGQTGWTLYRHGAVMVQAAGPAGCLNWSRPADL